MENSIHNSTAPFQKALYLLFVFFAIYQVFVKAAYVDAAASLGIALAFDPFQTLQPWSQRPNWQKIVLFVHLVFVVALFGLGVGLGDK